MWRVRWAAAARYRLGDGAERRPVVLGEMVAVEAGLVGVVEELQAAVVECGQVVAAPLVDPVEDAEADAGTFGPAVAWDRGRLAHGRLLAARCGWGSIGSGSAALQAGSRRGRRR
jgi:hypothetical protein